MCFINTYTLLNSTTKTCFAKHAFHLKDTHLFGWTHEKENANIFCFIENEIMLTYVNTSYYIAPQILAHK